MALAFCKVLQLLRSCDSTQGQNVELLLMEYLACEWLDKDKVGLPQNELRKPILLILKLLTRMATAFSIH